MLHCSQCSKFMIFSTSSGLCKKCLRTLEAERSRKNGTVSCVAEVARPKVPDRRALMVVPDPCAPFIMAARANGYSPNKNMLQLEDNEVCCAQFSTGSVRITAMNGHSIVAKNNLPYLQQLQRYGSGAENVVYALPALINSLYISSGDIVYIESC